MDLELFIILALIIVFLVSCCGLIQKIRENYEEDRGRVISVTRIHVPNQMYNNNSYNNGDEIPHGGVFPSFPAPPPYAEYLEPPPKYEDLIKENQHTVIQMEEMTGRTRTVQINATETETSTDTNLTTSQPERTPNHY